MTNMLDNIAGPRSSTHRLGRAVIWGMALWTAISGAAIAGDDTPKPPAKSSEEVILERIDQLQNQLDELRAALMAVRKEREAPAAAVAAPAAAAPIKSAAAPTPAAPAPARPPLPVDPQQTPS